MTLSDIANIGDFLSAIAVMISLIYLALQVRQAEKSQRSIANQGVATRSTEIVRWSAEPHISALRTRVIAGDTDFTAQEIMQLSFILRVSLLAVQDSYLQHNAGLTDDITFNSAVGGVMSLLASPVYRALWLRTRSYYSVETQAYIDRLIAETPLVEPVDIVSRFRSDLAAVAP
ncbi:MAG TPA: hypothetical protein VGG10_21280 [Rhizomicrobium sp.]|jgi:hypothetical protein